MIRTYCIKNSENRTIDITNVVKNEAKLKKNINEFAWVLDFNITRNNIFNNIEVGDIIVLKLDNKEIFSGIVITGDITNLTFKAVDYAWYFNKNEEIYQFEDVESSIVVRKLIETFGGKTGNIETTNTVVDKFYFGKSLGSIIKEIIKNIKDLENQEFRFFYRDTKFHFERSKKNKYLRNQYLPINSLKAVLNDYSFNALNYIKEPKRKLSIEGMHNAIKVYKTSGKEYIQISGARDKNNIDKYGLMQKLVSYKDNDLNGGNVTADSILSQENKVKEIISLEIPTLSEFIYDGELLNLNYEKYGIKGVYEVRGITYIFTNHKDIFLATIELERV
ncbi:XkdQ/YqbQ family protein [Fusobacterium perfoetens]|uniref:XkdQ/YqbQ family protein n=1 Tax=Fusobacterium perfoetens TaxID=852 RepID=UPI001F1B8290|nr:hypothetical protein [Fusobacterium perfoetens]MCF2611747.1 hypothetical protein [Fusobacterium perfoetens]